MSDPQPAHLKKKPPRAEPLQPDAPVRGDDAEDSSGTDAQTASDEKLKKQNEDAMKNVREGYG